MIRTQTATKIFLILLIASTASADFNSLKAETDALYSNRTLQDWKDQSIYRGVTQRSQKDFDWLKSMYPAKVTRLTEMLAGSTDKEKQAFLTAKVARIKDKFAVVCMEEKMRADGDVVRTNLHDQTDYFIDYDNGNDGSAGTAIGTAWKTFSQYTTTTVRTPGDRAFIRAGITWDQGTEATDIIFDEDGTNDVYISIIGCDSVTNDPWSDADDTLPIVDFEDAAFQFNINNDDYWYISRLDVRQSADTSGQISIGTTKGVKIEGCEIKDGGASNGEGVTLGGGGILTLIDCTFTDTWGASISNNGYVCLDGCTIDAGAVRGAAYAIFNDQGIIYAEDCSFAPANAFDTYEIEARNTAQIYMRNCVFGVAQTYNVTQSSNVFEEDADAVFEAHITRNYRGVITRDTGTVRGGGADSSAKMEPASDCGANNPLVLGNPLSGFSRVWATKDIQIDIDVYVAVGSAWDSALTAAECYATFSYLDHAVDATRTVIQSDDTITNDTNFTTALDSGNFTPLQTGFVYIWVYLEEFEDASEHIFVDIKPVVN